MSQTTVSMRMDKARAGQISDASPKRIRSMGAETGLIPFGYGVVPGTDKFQQAKLPTANTQKFAGVATLTLAMESTYGGSDLPGYQVKEAMNIMTEGAVWVVLEASSTAAADDPLYMIPSGSAAGRFSKNANDGAGTPVAYITTPLKVLRVYTETNPVTRILAEVVFQGAAS